MHADCNKKPHKYTCDHIGVKVHARECHKFMNEIIIRINIFIVIFFIFIRRIIMDIKSLHNR